VARQKLGHFLRRANYRRSLFRLGYTEADMDGPSDALVDALVLHGSADAVAAPGRTLQRGRGPRRRPKIVTASGEADEEYSAALRLLALAVQADIAR
jgi:hypothetical protein